MNSGLTDEVLRRQRRRAMSGGSSTSEGEVSASDFKPTSFDVAMLGESAIEEIHRELRLAEIRRELATSSEAASESD